MEKMLKTKEIADLLAVSVPQVYQWVREGELPSYRLGSGPKAELRFTESEVRMWLEANRK